jgi:hypothetical protein
MYIETSLYLTESNNPYQNHFAIVFQPKRLRHNLTSDAYTSLIKATDSHNATNDTHTHTQWVAIKGQL